MHSATARTAFLISLAALLCGLVFIGPQIPHDTHRYHAEGIKLWQWFQFNAGAPPIVVREFAVLYAAANLIVAGGYGLLGSLFPATFVVANIVLFALAVAICFKTAELMRPGGVPLVAGLALVFAAPDLAVWSYYVLFDVLLVAILAALWWCMARAVLHDSRRDWLLGLVLAGVSALVRPTGIVAVAFWFAAAAYTYSKKRGVSRWTRTAAFVLVPTAGALLVWPYFVYREIVANGGSALFPQVFEELFRYYRVGAIICDRVETYLGPPQTYGDVVRINVLRVLAYFYPLRQGYSTAHNIAAGLYVACLGILAARGAARLWRSGPRQATLASLVLVFAAYFGLFHSMTYVDYDWRYQLPWVLAAIPLAMNGVIAPTTSQRFAWFFHPNPFGRLSQSPTFAASVTAHKLEG